MCPNSMGQHAGEHQHEEHDTFERRLAPADPPLCRPDPDQEEQKGHMDAHHRAGDSDDGDGPEHEDLRQGAS